jgi:hypothetical protein
MFIRKSAIVGENGAKFAYFLDRKNVFFSGKRSIFWANVAGWLNFRQKIATVRWRAAVPVARARGFPAIS